MLRARGWMRISNVVLAAGIWLAAGSAAALSVGPPTVTMNGYEVSSYGVLVDGGVTAQWNLGAYAGGSYSLDYWTVSVDEDPWVTNNFLITNTSGVTQTYVATVSLPIPAFAYSLQKGSISISVTDGSATGVDPGDGVTLASVSPDPIYTGLVNGLPSLTTILPDPSSVSCAGDGCSNAGVVNVPFGPAGPGSATTIALTLKFTLTAGDSAGITSRFDIIPEPTTALLLGAGLAGLLVAGRRRA